MVSLYCTVEVSVSIGNQRRGGPLGSLFCASNFGEKSLLKTKKRSHESKRPRTNITKKVKYIRKKYWPKSEIK